MPERTNSTANQRRVPGIAIAGGLVLIGLCFCVVMAIFLQASGRSRAYTGMGVTWCAGVTTSPRLQAGIVWVTPVSSYLPPLMTSPYAVCVDLPPGMAPPGIKGEWLFPP